MTERHLQIRLSARDRGVMVLEPGPFGPPRLVGIDSEVIEVGPFRPAGWTPPNRGPHGEYVGIGGLLSIRRRGVSGAATSHEAGAIVRPVVRRYGLSPLDEP
jgi:hypothetical protein